MILIEGPDGTGKTTLARKVAAHIGGEYVRYQRAPDEDGQSPDEGVWAWWKEQFGKPDRVTKQWVYDRCAFISEVPYAMVQPGRTLIAPDVMLAGIQSLWIESPLIIFCLPPWTTAHENIRRQKEEDRLRGLTDEDLEKVHWAYWYLYGLWSEVLAPGFVFSFDYTRQDETQLLKEVENYV